LNGKFLFKQNKKSIVLKERCEAYLLLLTEKKGRKRCGNDSNEKSCLNSQSNEMKQIKDMFFYPMMTNKKAN